jgi:hypothetical protein
MRYLEPSVYLGIKLDLVTGAVCVGPWRCALLAKALVLKYNYTYTCLFSQLFIKSL